MLGCVSQRCAVLWGAGQARAPASRDMDMRGRARAVLGFGDTTGQARQGCAFRGRAGTSTSRQGQRGRAVTVPVDD